MTLIRVLDDADILEFITVIAELDGDLAHIVVVVEGFEGVGILPAIFVERLSSLAVLIRMELPSLRSSQAPILIKLDVMFIKQINVRIRVSRAEFNPFDFEVGKK